MGCSTSKKTQKQIEEYQKKVEEIQEVNAQLIQQIQELKENKNKKKPIYVVSDQEVHVSQPQIDDLYVFKTELDKRFEKIDGDMEKIKIQLNEEQPGLEMIEDIEMTIKPFPDPVFEISEDQSQKSKKVSTKIINNDEEQNELKKTVPKSNMNNQSDLSKQLAEAIGEEMKEFNEGLKSKLFYNTTTPVSEEPKQVKQQNSKQRSESKGQTDVKQTPKVKTDVIKRKQVRANSQADKTNSTQQHFFSKQQTGGGAQKSKNSIRKKQIEQY